MTDLLLVLMVLLAGLLISAFIFVGGTVACNAGSTMHGRDCFFSLHFNMFDAPIDVGIYGP